MPDPMHPEGEEPRPEPVLDAARLAGLLSAVVVALLGAVGVVLAGNVLGNLTALGNALTAVGVAVAALASYLLPVWQARRARAKVTPLERPQDAAGRPLVPEQTPEPARETYAGADDDPGEHSEERAAGGPR